MSDIESFLSRVLVPPTGTSKQDTKNKLLHWIEVANKPEKFTVDNSTHALRAIRRSARQNVRRLALRHPAIASEIVIERGLEAQ